MKTHSIFQNASLLITAGCLGAGYISAGYWLILPALLAILLLWLYARKRPGFWPAASLLAAAVLLAAIGISLDLPAALMIVACISALVNWDLLQFNASTTGASPSKLSSAFEKHHLQSLALAASSGLILALVSSFLELHFPFVVIVILVLVALGGIVYSAQYIQKRNFEAGSEIEVIGKDGETT